MAQIVCFAIWTQSRTQVPIGSFGAPAFSSQTLTKKATTEMSPKSMHEHDDDAITTVNGSKQQPLYSILEMIFGTPLYRGAR